MPAVPLQRPAAPWSEHHWWGQFDDAPSLPNVAGSDYQIAGVQAGDVAWAVAEAALYVCSDGTLGAAVWVALSAGAGVDSTSLISWGSDNLTATTTDRYLYPGWDSGGAPTAIRNRAMPRAGIIRNLFVRHNTGNGNGNPVVYTVVLNGVPTALSVSKASGAIGSVSNVSDTVVVAQGDLIALVATKAAATGSGDFDVLVTAEFA
jgi:hypothetical protein